MILRLFLHTFAERLAFSLVTFFLAKQKKVTSCRATPGGFGFDCAHPVLLPSPHPSPCKGEGVLPPRMMHRMQLLQPLPRHMRIDLRRRNIRMTQQHLHHAQVGTVVQQVRGEGVPQGVR